MRCVAFSQLPNLPFIDQSQARKCLRLRLLVGLDAEAPRLQAVGDANMLPWPTAAGGEGLTARPRPPQVAGGAAGLLLLGRIARLTGRQAEAAAHFSAALERDPLTWVAFEELCQLGAPFPSPHPTGSPSEVLTLSECCFAPLRF